MTPSARLQAAIELVDAIAASAQTGGAAADTLIARYFKDRRYAGSKDRRAVRDLVYRAIRAIGDMPVSGRAALLALGQGDPQLLDLFDGSERGPARPVPGEPVAPTGLIPAWIGPLLDPLVEAAEQAALLERAPLDLRVNRLRASREEVAALLPEAAPTPLSPLGLRLPEGYRVEEGPAWANGLIEIQDEGSQLLALACQAAPDETVVDLCAGAGGKTLALGAEMQNSGRIIATDADRGRLSRMAPRLARAGLTIVEPRLLNPGREAEAITDLAGTVDLVIVDAPCSGSGTWRRNPETRWRLTPDRLDRIVALQARLLDVAETLVRPGGRLVYAVCSLLAREGRDQANALSARSSLEPHPVPITAGREAGQGRLLTPGHDGTDGFFVACWQRPC